MTQEEVKGTTIQIMGKTYQIKCPDQEIEALQRAARYLEEKMTNAREVGKVLSLDRIAVIAALNIAYEFLNLENQNTALVQTISQRLGDIQNKIERTMECSSAE